MSYYEVGELIKKVRNQRGISQATLADGIISTANLSRLENGSQMPQKEKLDKLLERLGINSQDTCSYYLLKKDFDLHSKKDEIKSLVVTKKFDEAKRLINELSETDESSDVFLQQFIMHSKASIMVNEEKQNSQARTIVLDALHITVQSFSEKYITEYFLSDQEVELVNMLAITYFNEGNTERGVKILKDLRISLDASRVDEKEKGKLFPLILYNLSKYLGLTEQYEEGLEACNYAIDICLRQNNLQLLPNLLINKACDLYHLGEVEASKRFFLQSYYGFEAHQKPSQAEEVKVYARDELGIDLEKIFI